MPVTVYRSTDASAPVLSGTAGTLIGVLDAVLVNGYGSKAAAGWSKPYSGTNLAVYRAGGGTRLYYRVDETAAFTRDVGLRGYEVMTGVSAGTGEFPRVADLANGVLLRRSNTVDSVARAWTILADNKTCLMFLYDGSLLGYARGHMMGDYHSYAPSPAYNAMVIGGNHTLNATSSVQSALSFVSGSPMDVVTQDNVYWLARDYTQIGNCKNAGIHVDYVKNGGSAYMGAGANTLTYPNPANTGVYLSPVWIHRSGVVYGEIRGLWCPCHNQPFADGDTFAGSGELAGKTFMAIRCYHSTTTHQVVVETSDTWKN